MKYLLDTQALLWITNNDPKLSAKVKNLFLNQDNDMDVSMATIWEMSVKISLQKLFIPGNIADFVRDHIRGNQINIMKIELAHIYQLENLKFYHRDPFDRLIISQALAESIPIISYDKMFDKYPIRRVW